MNIDKFISENGDNLNELYSTRQYTEFAPREMPFDVSLKFNFSRRIPNFFKIRSKQACIIFVTFSYCTLRSVDKDKLGQILYIHFRIKP